MKKHQLIKTLCFSSLAIMALSVTHYASSNTFSDEENIAKSTQNRVDPSSPEYIEVGTEAEFRAAVESDNEKTYIKMTADIQLLQGQVIIPASKTNLTIDGYYESQTGKPKRYNLQSGHPVISNIVPGDKPPQVTDLSKQKVLYINNDNTKDITMKDVTATTRFIAGVVDVANNRNDVNVTLHNTDVFGPMGVVNHNGSVNFTGTSRVQLSDTFNDITLIRSRGVVEANIVNVLGEITADDFNDNTPIYKTLFRMYTSGNYSPRLTIMPKGKVKTPDDGRTIQSFVWGETTPATLTLMKGAEVDVSIMDAFNNHWGLSSLIVEDGALLKIERLPGNRSPDARTNQTISLTKGFTAKKGSQVEVKNDPSSNITAAIFGVQLGGAIDILEPARFDISGSQNNALFSSPQGSSLINILLGTNTLTGWTDMSSSDPTHTLSGPLQAQYSLFYNQSTLMSSTIDSLAEYYPINDMHRMLIE